MFKTHRLIFTDNDEQDGANRQTASLAGLAFALFLVVVGLFLVKTLRSNASTEDCLLSGRTNCAPIVVTSSSGGHHPFP